METSLHFSLHLYMSLDKKMGILCIKLRLVSLFTSRVPGTRDVCHVSTGLV